jgi:putative PIN family toxin of toxin-antitoxin system
VNVILDTNILVGAAITPKGPAGRIVEAWRLSRFNLIVSSTLLEEIERALTYRRVRRYLTWSDTQLHEFLELLGHTSLLVDLQSEAEAISRDPGDDHILEAAVAGRADYIVSNDDDLLALSVYQGIEIVTAARFAAILAELS